MLRRLRIENLVLIREAELELDAGLNAITGETGAGKTILSSAIGMLLGARADVSAIGPAASEAYVEAEFDVPDDEELGALAELRPHDEDALVLARRIFADGRTRAYAWGRSAAREDAAGPIAETSPRAPSSSPTALERMVLPAPVSPVIAFRPASSSSSASRIRTRFSMRRRRSTRPW